MTDAVQIGMRRRGEIVSAQAPYHFKYKGGKKIYILFHDAVNNLGQSQPKGYFHFVLLAFLSLRRELGLRWINLNVIALGHSLTAVLKEGRGNQDRSLLKKLVCAGAGWGSSQCRG